MGSSEREGAPYIPALTAEAVDVAMRAQVMNNVVTGPLREFVYRFVSLPPLRRGCTWLGRRGAPVFMFHRVLPEGETCYDPEMLTSINAFRAFLDWICERYQVISVETLVRMNGRLAATAKPYCAITFDDGWSDTFSHAFPCLQERRLTATVFLPTRFIGTKLRFWQERLWYGIRGLTTRGEVDRVLGLVTRSFPWYPALSGARWMFDDVRRTLLTRPSRECEDFVNRLEELGGQEPPPSRSFMTWDEVRTMQGAGMTFGSHTANHTLLTRTAPALAEREIKGSRLELAERLGSTVTAFSYPWGGVSEHARRCVKEAGYSFAVTTRPCFVPENADPWLVPRLPVSDSFLSGPKQQVQMNRMNFYLARKALRGTNGASVCRNHWNSRARLRIAFVIDAIDSWEGGGTERQLANIIDALDRRYFEPELCFLRPSSALDSGDFPCPVHVAGSRPEVKWYNPGVLIRLVRLFRLRRPHVVQTFFRDGTYYGTVAAQIARVPVIVNGVRNAGHWKTPTDKIILKIISHLVDFWQCNSRAVVQSLITQGVPASRIAILPNAIDLTRFSPPAQEERMSIRRKLGLSLQGPVIVSVANLWPVKDPATFVSAAKRVTQSLRTAQFILVGEGPLRASLEQQIDRLGLTGRVRIAGAQSDVWPYLAASDVAVLTSQSEASSNSILEYMAMGLPTVLSDIPANRDLADGIFFEFGNASDLAEKILMLWGEGHLREELSCQHRWQAMHHGLESVAECAQAFYGMLADHWISR